MLRKRPVMGVFILFCIGVLLNNRIFMPFWLGVLLTFLCSVLAALFFHKRRASLIFLACTFVLLGYVCTAGQKKLAANHIAYAGRQSLYRDVFLEGIVVSPVTEREVFGTTKMIFTLESRLLERRWVAKKTQGRVLVNIYGRRPLKYGDHVRLYGKLHRPFNFKKTERFSYPDYLKRKGIFLVVDVKKTSPIKILARHQANGIVEWSLDMRGRLMKVFSKYLTRSEAGIMQAIVLGERTQIPRPVRDVFIRTGTAHVLAISGLHVGIVAAIIFLFLKLLPLKRRWQYILTIVLLAAYALLTGMRPSVIRATIMASVFLFSFILERETDSLNTLAVAGFIILLLNPVNLSDIGFQLSFASVFAIIVFYPIIWARFDTRLIVFKHKCIKFIFQSFCGSLAAWLGVAGLIVYYFEIITPLSIFANIIVIPLITIVVALGLGVLITGTFTPLLGYGAAACLKVALNFTIFIIYLINKIPYSYFETGPLSLWPISIYYILLGLLWQRSLRAAKS